MAAASRPKKRRKMLARAYNDSRGAYAIVVFSTDWLRLRNPWSETVARKKPDPITPTLKTIDVARRLGVCREKVLTWIKSGELKAIDVRGGRNGKSLFRIDPVELAAFESRRGSAPLPKTRRRRRQAVDVPDFYPD